MSEFPIPKYKLGDKVFQIFITDTTKKLPCPDCKDTGLWEVTTALGDKFNISCGRCQYNYGRSVGTNLSITDFVGDVRVLTIGKVSIDYPCPDYSKHPVSYMCEETGIGSGTNHYESDLFESKEEASKFIEQEITKKRLLVMKDVNTQWTLALAKSKASFSIKEERSKSVWDISYHFGQLRNCLKDWIYDNKDLSSDSREQLESFLKLRYHIESKQNPLVELVEICRGIVEYDETKTKLAECVKKFDFVPTKEERDKEIADGRY